MKTILTLAVVIALTGCATVADNTSGVMKFYDLVRVLQ